jgi:hypothetical protein
MFQARTALTELSFFGTLGVRRSTVVDVKSDRARVARQLQIKLLTF